MPASAVDTFLSTVVSKTVPLLQNKQLNYKQNDIRQAKFRENIRQSLQKNVLLGSPEQTPTNLQTELLTVKIFVLFGKVSQRRRFLQQAKYPTRKTKLLSASRCVEKNARTKPCGNLR